MRKVFVSYSRHSESAARNIVGDLDSLGHKPWFDRQLSGGQPWWNEILAAIRDCDLLVLLLDSDTLNSAACKGEYGYALALGKSVLPILVADDFSVNLMPQELSRIQFVDYREPDRASAIGLARALTTVPPSSPLPNQLPPPPELPASYLASLARMAEVASPISYEEQGAMLLDLRKNMRASDTRNDARLILQKLRCRRDLFATVAEEIDELLGVRKSGLVVEANETRSKDWPIQSLALLDMYGRVGRMLLDMAETEGDKKIIRNKISLQDVATVVDTSQRTVGQIMKELQRRGLVKPQENGSTVVK